MNEPKPEDVMRALDKLKYGGHSCHDCKYAKWSGEDRCGLNGCRIAKAALALLREKDAEIERLKKDREELIVTLKMNDAPFPEGLQIVHDFCEKRKMEVITEFAERLKSEVNGGQFASYKGLEIRNVIDQIAKEIKEGSDGSDDVH